VQIPDEDYFKQIKEICEKNNILFIADEVITGFGRTGKYFGIEHFDVVPDIMTIAKGVTSGYAALGGVVINEDIHKDLIYLSDEQFYHGYTYSGHPTSSVIASKNIEIIERENLIENARVMGEIMLEGFKYLQEKHDIVGEVRTIGLMGAIEIVKDKETNARFENPLVPHI